MWNNIENYIDHLPPYGRNLLLALAALLTGLVVKGIMALLLHYYSRAESGFSIFRSMVIRLSKPLNWFLPLLILNIVLPMMELTAKQAMVFQKVAYIAMVVSIAFLLIATIKVFEDLVYHVYDLNKEDNLRERKVRTQLQFLRKVAVSLIVLLAIGAVLLSFSSLRRIGTGLLTGVGISGIIVGFAAQRSLANLLAGLQIAFTQPIRIDDVLVVEGEWGKVEEITLTYVVLNIWDQRRLILPINYFIDKPFQNWTRNSAEIVGTVFLSLDYCAPVETIRQAFLEIIAKSPLWDKRVAELQVTDTNENVMQLRMLMSASNSSNAFDLRCYIREQMIAYVQQHHPEALPVKRTTVQGQQRVVVG